MKPVFETTGTCLNIKLPEELDHPASELIRRESDRIMGKYISEPFVLTLEILFYGQFGRRFDHGEIPGSGDAFWLHEGLPCKRIY